MQPTEVLIATLGSEPQVVTLALDCLRGRQHPITCVTVIHTAADQEPICTSLARLKAELPSYRALKPSVVFHFVPIECDNGTFPPDITTEQEAGAVFRTIYREVLKAKRKGWRVHLSIAGGRKVMSAYGLAVGQMLFDENDCLWHVLSEGKLLSEKQMHAQSGEDIVLVPIPVLLWSTVSPVFTELACTEDPYQAVKKQRALHEAETVRRKQEFFERELSPAERQLMELFVREPMSNKQLAARLHRSPKTVANQFSAIFDKLERCFRMSQVDRTVLVAEFASLFRKNREKYL